MYFLIVGDFMEEKNNTSSILHYPGTEVHAMQESNTRTRLLRALSVLMSGYFLILFFLFYKVNQPVLMMAALLCLMSHLLLFFMTFYNKGSLTFALLNVFFISWLLLFIYMLGWDCGVQHFVFVLVVLACFSIHHHINVKIIYTIVLCGIRLGMYFYTKVFEPIIVITEDMSTTFQIINTVTIFIAISVVALITSSYAEETEKKLTLYNHTLEKAASTDALTLLPNRRGILAYLDQLFDKNQDTQEVHRFSIVIGDVDLFKKVNDQFGHECGDVVLKEISRVFSDFMKDKGQVSRWGGEEFLFVFDHFNKEETSQQLESLNERIKKLVLIYEEHPIHIALTYGVAEYCGGDYHHTIMQADQKLFVGKRSGRNQIVL